MLERERIARIIDPEAWARRASHLRNAVAYGNRDMEEDAAYWTGLADRASADSLAKADAILTRPAAPVEGMADQAWQDLLDKDDRTSPAEYPDMALITHDELAAIIAALAEAQAREVARLREALTEIASDDFRGPPGISIYPAAVNELVRLKKVARSALNSTGERDE